MKGGVAKKLSFKPSSQNLIRWHHIFFLLEMLLSWARKSSTSPYRMHQKPLLSDNFEVKDKDNFEKKNHLSVIIIHLRNGFLLLFLSTFIVSLFYSDIYFCQLHFSGFILIFRKWIWRLQNLLSKNITMKKISIPHSVTLYYATQNSTFFFSFMCCVPSGCC